jgi:two-component system sensor histidine kinase/response regulator
MSKAHLLVVEDEPYLLDSIRYILEIDNYHVTIAKNGLEALNILNTEGTVKPDLIVSDIMMPHMDGFEFLRQVRNNPDWVFIPFIFLTAKGSRQDVHQGKLLGVDDYLTKPFDSDDLLVAVASKLGRYYGFQNAQARAIGDIKRNILTILNHEFRTPLTSVVGYSDMLQDGDVSQMNANEIKSYLTEINSGAIRLRRLVENFITLVDLRTGDAQKNYEGRRQIITSVDTILKNAIEKVFNNEKVTCECQLIMDDTLPHIIGDAEYIHIIFNELLNNSVKFTTNSQPVLVEARNVEHKLLIKIRNFGRSIRPEHIQYIWDEFYQSERAEFEDQGAGSGLAIVKGLIELHNAEIFVESANDQTCFTLIFPSATYIK